MSGSNTGLAWESGMIRTYVSPPLHAVEAGSVFGSPEFGVGPEELLEWSNVLYAKKGAVCEYSVFNRAGYAEGVITCEKQSRVGGPEGLGSCLPRGGTPTRSRAPLWRQDGWQIAEWEQPWRSEVEVDCRELQFFVPRMSCKNAVMCVELKTIISRWLEKRRCRGFKRLNPV